VREHELDPDYEWPSMPRSLHGEGSDWRQTASLGWNRGGWYTRIRGFRVAAELLAAHVSEHRHEQDGIIFPFLYNWRQHIELALKQLIVETEQLLDLHTNPPRGHNLHSLWARWRSGLVHAGRGSADELDNVEAFIHELHELDPYGDAFRYPVSVDGVPTLEAVDHLSFERITEAVVPVANFLEAAAMAISVDLENKQDFERDIAAGGY
jgi:hypothetical protein